MPKPAFSVERTSPTVVTMRATPKAGWEAWALLRSDAHHDSLHCDQKLEKQHLEQAKERGAAILDFGDCFDAMAGKWDKRADPRQFRPELQGPNYLDTLVRYNAEFYEPYLDNWLFMSPGNHETAIDRHHETNICERLAERLKQKGSPVQLGTYAGWIRFLFSVNGSGRHSLKLRYTHGYGGAAPVTHGVINTARELVYLPDCDLLLAGHTHTSYHVTIRKEVLLDSGRTELRDVECLRCPGYKDEFSCGVGWANERGMAPRPKGAWWVRFFLPTNSKTVSFEVHRAK